MTKRIKLPKGWHRGKPRKAGIYCTSRGICVENGSVYGWGYAEWTGVKWKSHKDWGNHFGTSDFIWSAPPAVKR